MKIYRDADADTDLLSGKKVAVIGYGAQGRAQARMLYESGVNVVVGVRQGGSSWQKVQEDGLPVATIADAAASADIVHILIPDEIQKNVYESEIAQGLSDGNILSFSHGFSIVFGQIVPPKGVGVIMVAPKSPGTEEYKCYRQGFGVPGLVSVHQDTKEENARDLALALSKAMFFTKAGVLECSFEQEAYEDLFGEQAVLCGGISELIKAGFEVLVEAGYPPELAYFECLHETKLIVDLIYEGGLTQMWDVVSNTAEYGGRTRGPRLITEETKNEMRKILREVEDATFAKQWVKEAGENKFCNLNAMREEEAKHPIEVIGKQIRALFDKSQQVS